MAVSWYIAPTVVQVEADGGIVERHPAVYEQWSSIRADGGHWEASEVLGDAWLVKIRAAATTLSTLGALAGWRRIPLDRLDARLSTLGTVIRNGIRTRVLALGYTSAEFDAALPAWPDVTLDQLLAFIAQRRHKPRWDDVAQAVVLDGPVQPCRSIADLEARVTA